MRAVVEALERVPGDRLVPVDMAARGAELGKVALRREEAADAIHDDAHCDAGTRTLGEHAQRLVCGAAAQEQIHLEVNAAPCAAHCFQLRGVDRRAVVQHIELARGEEPRVDDRAQVVHELARAQRRARRCHAVGQPRLEEQQQDERGDDDDRRDGDGAAQWRNTHFS